MKFSTEMLVMVNSTAEGGGGGPVYNIKIQLEFTLRTEPGDILYATAQHIMTLTMVSLSVSRSNEKILSTEYIIHNLV